MEYEYGELDCAIRWDDAVDALGKRFGQQNIGECQVTGETTRRLKVIIGAQEFCFTMLQVKFLALHMEISDEGILTSRFPAGWPPSTASRPG